MSQTQLAFLVIRFVGMWMWYLYHMPGCHTEFWRGATGAGVRVCVCVCTRVCWLVPPNTCAYTPVCARVRARVLVPPNHYIYIYTHIHTYVHSIHSEYTHLQVISHAYSPSLPCACVRQNQVRVCAPYTIIIHYYYSRQTLTLTLCIYTYMCVNIVYTYTRDVCTRR